MKRAYSTCARHNPDRPRWLTCCVISPPGVSTIILYSILPDGGAGSKDCVTRQSPDALTVWQPSCKESV
jgi:hypothetical protein